MNWAIQRKFINASFLFALAILIVIEIISYRQFLLSNSATDRVIQTHLTIEASERLLFGLKEAQSEERGYLLTGSAYYLDPYNANIRDIYHQLTLTRQLIQGDRFQQQNLELLEPLIQDLLTVLNDAIVIRQKKGIAAAADLTRTDSSRNLMAQIKQVVTVIEDEAQEQLAHKNATATNKRHKTFQISFIGFLLSLGFLIPGYILLNKQLNERKRAEDALAENQRKLELAIKAAYIGVYERDILANELLVNGNIAHMLGIDQAHLIRDMDDFRNYIHPDDLGSFNEAIQKAVDGNGELVSEYRVIQPNGEVHWLTERGIVIKNFQGTYTRVYGAIIDTTERKLTEIQLIRQAQELKRSNEELEQFAYVASHDLQEPLRMVGSYTQLLHRRYKNRLDANADEFMGFIINGATRMQQLIDDLLTFSRVGTKQGAFTSLSSEAAFKKALDILKIKMDESQAIITSDPLPSVKADQSQLILLFQNLIGNALKFHKKGEAPRIHISARKIETGWVFSVKDNGIGMEKQYLERIFIIFQRLHSRAEFPGTGIGLAICKKIVERHNGRIWVESEPDQGSIFYFSIPNNIEKALIGM